MSDTISPAISAPGAIFAFKSRDLARGVDVPYTQVSAVLDITIAKRLLSNKPLRSTINSESLDEDSSDLAAIAEAKAEGGYRPYAEFRKELLKK
jgi:hypothetical protein